MAQRVLAVIGAVALVLVAIVVRGALDEDGGGGDDTDRGDANEELFLMCDDDFEDLCRALDGLDGLIVEESVTTSLSLVENALPEADAWLTSDAWFVVTEGRAADRGGSIGTAELLGTSPVVVAVDPDRTDAVTALCEGQPLWRCLGDHAGAPWSELGGQPTWGGLATGLPDADTATGLSVLTSVTVGFYGGTEFAANDFRGEFETWLDSLAAERPGGDPDPAGTLVTRRGTYSAAGTTAARTSAITRPFAELAAEPRISSGAVLVDLRGGDDVAPLRSLRNALESAGWAPASGTPELPVSPGVLAALHTLWTETTR